MEQQDIIALGFKIHRRHVVAAAAAVGASMELNMLDGHTAPLTRFTTVSPFRRLRRFLFFFSDQQLRQLLRGDYEPVPAPGGAPQEEEVEEGVPVDTYNREQGQEGSGRLSTASPARGDWHPHHGRAHPETAFRQPLGGITGPRLQPGTRVHAS